MTQVKKESVKEAILNAAKTEFLEHGFRLASMRKIAAAASVSFSNIYSYFQNKDELFAAVVKPTVEFVTKHLEHWRNRRETEDTLLYPYLEETEDVNSAYELIDKYRDDFKLLALLSDGSSMEGFMSRLFAGHDEIMYQQYKRMAVKKDSEVKTDISQFFFRNLMAFRINFVIEMLKQDIPLRTMKHYAREFHCFIYFGLQSLLEKSGE